MDRKSWKLGDTASLFESHGDADTVSRGDGDLGGVSYGIYQMSSQSGTAAEYVKGSKFATDFKGLTPGTESFSRIWKKVAVEHPDFGDDQHEFIKRTHMDPVVATLSRRGIDVETRGPAFQDMVWSMSVQHRRNTPALIERAIHEAYGASADISHISDTNVVRAVQQSKLVHVHDDFRSSNLNIREGVETRIRVEERVLVRLSETGTLGTAAELSADWREASPVRSGSPPERIVEVQQKLQKLGVLDEQGARLVADGDFGPSTQFAVRTFQNSVGLPDTGRVSALAMFRLDEQVNARDVVVSRQEATRVPQAVCRLDDPVHPDHEFFKQVRGHVVELDKSLGRSPDRYTDSIASALTVQARADGLHRVDQVALSKDGNALWALQTPPGRRDNLFDVTTKVPTSEANTPMEQSGARWPEAMQQFQGHQQAQALSQQQAQDRSQAESQAQQVSGPSMSR